jgi:MoaA/NifB/PqqE/SkfB family radical SAM enzyme
MRPDLRGALSWDDACRVVDLWIADRLRHVRFSGGEPTLWPRLPDLCARCLDGGVERIAISTNGSADLALYRALIDAGVSDFSVSLDACCASLGDAMAGGRVGAWTHVVESIRFLSAHSYTTVGIVFTEDNWRHAADTVAFADSLGVSDIRVVSSAQLHKALTQLAALPDSILRKYPVLRYRIENVRDGRDVRTMCESDCGTCRLALDDMAVAGSKHFPCIIYLREGGDPIGDVGPQMRTERAEWVKHHDAHADPICSKMCLDVCIDYNNRANEFSTPNGADQQIDRRNAEGVP